MSRTAFVIVSLLPAALAACSSSPERSAPPSVTFDAGTRKEIAHDVHALLDQGLPVAVTMLQKTGSFLPFGGVVYDDGRVEGFGPKQGTTHDANEVHTMLQDALRRAVGDRGIAASAIFSNGEATLPSQAGAVPAIRVEVEHQDGYAADLLVPYRLADGKVSLQDVVVRSRSARVFPSSQGQR